MENCVKKLEHALINAKNLFDPPKAGSYFLHLLRAKSFLSTRHKRTL